VDRLHAILGEVEKLSPAEQHALAERLALRLQGGVPVALQTAIPGQIDGYWIRADAGVPALRPGYEPTGALLPREREALRTGATCLDLVFVEDAWYPLSEAGVYTYAHSSGLLYGERCLFVRADVQWASELYEAAYDDAIDSETVGRLYGHEAELRTRPDHPTMQLRLRRIA
jgi:hypothetical protein